MRLIFTYILIVLFSLGSAQAGMHYCVNMDMQDESTSDLSGNMSNDLALCHSQSEESVNNNSDSSCCDEGCDSCASVVVTFNSLKNNYGLAYTEQYKQYGSFFILSNHIKIPTPPPNS